MRKKKKSQHSKKEANIEEPPSAIHPNAIRTTANIIPNDEPHESNNVCCYAALADKQPSTLYTDTTGVPPHMSLDGKKYFLVAYNCNTNYIFAIPIPDVKDKTIIKAFDEIFTELTEKGYKPTFNVTDNQAASPIKAYLKKAG